MSCGARCSIVYWDYRNWNWQILSYWWSRMTLAKPKSVIIWRKMFFLPRITETSDSTVAIPGNTEAIQPHNLHSGMKHANWPEHASLNYHVGAVESMPFFRTLSRRYESKRSWWEYSIDSMSCGVKPVLCNGSRTYQQLRRTHLNDFGPAIEAWKAETISQVCWTRRVQRLI